MSPIFILICVFFGIIFAKAAKNMGMVGVYILLTCTGLALFLCGVYIFNIASMLAAAGSIAFTIVFLYFYLSDKKKRNS